MENYNSTIAISQVVLGQLGVKQVEQATIDKNRIDTMNKKNVGFEDSSRKVTWFSTQKTKVDIQVKDVQKSLEYVRMLNKMRKASTGASETWLPLTHSNHVRMEGSFDTEENEVIVSLGAAVYMPMTYDEAEVFFVEQLKVADRQVAHIEKDLALHTKVVTEMNDEALRMRYNIQDDVVEEEKKEE